LVSRNAISSGINEWILLSLFLSFSLFQKRAREILILLCVFDRKAIEAVLGHEITRLNENFRLPNEKEGIKYGMKKDGDNEAVFKIHEQFLRPIAGELFKLEDNVQKNFWNLQMRFSKKPLKAKASDKK
jgi:hypothetical protein